MARRGTTLRAAVAMLPLLLAGPASASEPAAAPTGGVWGAVRREGRPVEGARVSVRRLSGLRGGFAANFRAAPVGTATTDARGRFVVSGIAPAMCLVEASTPDGSATGVSPICFPETTEWVSATVVLEPAVPLAGHVLDADGSPFRGVVAFAVERENEGWSPRDAVRSGEADERGNFRLEAVPAVRGRLFAVRPGRDWRELGDPVTPGAARLELRLGAAAGASEDPPDDPPKPVGRVVGRVESAEGAPVAGVAVTVFEGGGAFLVRRASPVVSDAAGKFVVEGVESGPAWISALGAGRANARLSAPSDPPSGAERFDVPAGGEVARVVRVVDAGSVEGRVLDEEGRFVEGALVSWRTEGDTVECGSDRAPPAEAHVVTAADGAFRIASVPVGTHVALKITAPGYWPQEERLEVTRANPHVKGVPVLLGGARFVDVHVRLSGAPVERAAVRVSYESSAFMTGPDGRTVLGPLPRTRLDVSATHFDAKDRAETRLGPGDDESLELDLPRGLSIEGRVVDERGAPVPEASVNLDRLVPTPDSWRSVRADERGAFRFDGLAPGVWRLRAGPEGTPVEVAAGARDVVLRTTGDEAVAVRVLRVRVLAPDGTPVPQAAVRWSGPSGGDAPVVKNGKAEITLYDDAGTAGVVLEVYDARDAAGKPLPVAPARMGPLRKEDREVEIRLAPGRSVAGRVTFPTSTSLAGVEVVALSVPASTKSDSAVRLGSSPVAADGSFAVYGVEESGAVLTVHFSDERAGVGLVAAVPVVPGATDVLVPLAPRIGAVVTLLDERGQPALDLMVTAERDFEVFGREPHLRVRSDEKGRARLEGLVAGARYRLTVGETTQDDWTPQDTTIRLGPVAAVRGTVQDDAGQPLPTIVFAWTGEKPATFAVSDEKGAFTLFPPSFPIDVQAYPPFNPWGEEFAEEDLASPRSKAVRAGDTLTLVVRRGVRASLRIVDDEPGAWRDAHATLMREKEPWDPKSSAGYVFLPTPAEAAPLPPLLADARYVLWLPAGRTGRVAFTSFTAKEGAVVEVRPVAAGTVSGRVEAPDGAAGLHVGAIGHGFRVHGTAAGGAFSVPGVPPGVDLEVTATAEVAGVPWSARATTRAGGNVDLRLAPSR